MKNQNYTTIVVHTPMTNQTDFVQIRGKEMIRHIETELYIGRERCKRLTKHK